MFCPKCGTKNQENAQFCESCGTKLTAPESNQPKTVKKKPSNVQGKTILIILAVVVLIGIGASVYVYQSLISPLNNQPSSLTNTTSTPQIETSQYSDSAFSFNYPKTWVVNDTQIDSTGNAVYIIDPQFAADANAVKAMGVGVFALSKSSGVNKDTIVKDLTSGLTNRGTTQTATVTVDGVSATQSIVEGDNSQGHKTQYKIINWEKGDKIYIIACVAKGSDLGNTLDSQKAYFDTIINSFKAK